MSRVLNLLAPELEKRAKALRAAMRELGFPIFIYYTYRSERAQKILYAKGRTTPGPKVTNVKQGWHNIYPARAIDVAFKLQDAYSDRKSWDYFWPWKQMQRIAKSMDMVITLKWDKGHLVWKNGQTFKEAWTEYEAAGKPLSPR